MATRLIVKAMRLESPSASEDSHALVRLLDLRTAPDYSHGSE